MVEDGDAYAREVGAAPLRVVGDASRRCAGHESAPRWGAEPRATDRNAGGDGRAPRAPAARLPPRPPRNCPQASSTL